MRRMARFLRVVHRSLTLRTLCGLATLLLIVRSADGDTSLEVMHAFVRPPQMPAAGLVNGVDGALYGTTLRGGVFGHGTLFRLDPSGALEVVHSFEASVDGSSPETEMVQGSDGALYGVTPAGGAFGNGTLFKLDTSGQFSLLHSFQESVDGSAPAAALVRGSDGALYGSTSKGGPSGAGTLFKFDANGIFHLLHGFRASVDGSTPRTRLVRASDGALYGTTPLGGALGGGTIFKLDAGDGFVLLHTFGTALDGMYPDAELAEGADAALYGTTNGGSLLGSGGVFRIDADGQFTLLHSFNSARDGAYPRAPLRRGADAGLYGTTLVGGPFGYGTLFKIDTSSRFVLLRAFSGTSDGAYPSTALTQGSGDALYGSTGGGGIFGKGTLFKVDASGRFTSLHTFGSSSDGASPTIPLVLASDGSFYGATNTGGPANNGTVFRLDANDVFTSLGWFDADGVDPASALVLGRDGALYGTTSEGGLFGFGTLFRLDPRVGLKLLHSFKYSEDGANPRSPPLVRGRGEVLLGTTPRGGSLEGGTVFKFSGDTGFEVLHNFAGTGHGGSPDILLVRGRDGAFYGTTQNGGEFGLGTVFRIDERGRYELLHSFNTTDGAEPVAPLVWGRDRALYGSTWGGGLLGIGTLFKIDPAGAFTQLHSFGFTVDGDRPEKPLTLGRDGALYGATSGGGAFRYGTLFRIDSSGQFAVLHDFDYAVDGAYPFAPLVKARDGALYGSTLLGGALTSGTLFKIDARGRFRLLHSFDFTRDGAYPSAPLVQARDGALYGGTYTGGAFGSGTLFKVDEHGRFTLLHTFDPHVDGSGLYAPLVVGRDGALYGVASGGPGGGGVIYRVTVRGHQAPSNRRHLRGR
jgi:uncharacterized repeat protein (TIGR03803 family)